MRKKKSGGLNRSRSKSKSKSKSKSSGEEDIEDGEVEEKQTNPESADEGKKRLPRFTIGRKKKTEKTKEGPDSSASPPPQQPRKNDKETNQHREKKDKSKGKGLGSKGTTDGQDGQAANTVDSANETMGEEDDTPDPTPSKKVLKKQKRLKFDGEIIGSDPDTADPSTQLIPVQKEDLKGLPIHYSQMPSYIQVDFEDGTGPPVEVGGPALGKGAAVERRAVYVESSTTGRFFKVKLKHGEGGVQALRERIKKKHQEILEKRKKNISSQERAQVQATQLFQVLDTCFLVVQGALAGFSLTTVYYTYAAEDAARLLEEYDDLANEVRRLMYVLSMISFAGASEGYLRRRAERSTWKKRKPRDRGEWRVIVACYTLVLIATLACSPVDIRIFYHFSIEEDDWIEQAMDNSEFVDSLDSWYVFNMIRFIGCIIGWVLVCRDRHRESLKGYQSQQQAARLHEEAIDLKERVNHLSGKYLEKLPKEDLLDILALQKKAVQQTERTIDIQIRRELDKMF